MKGLYATDRLAMLAYAKRHGIFWSKNEYVYKPYSRESHRYPPGFMQLKGRQLTRRCGIHICQGLHVYTYFLKLNGAIKRVKGGFKVFVSRRGPLGVRR